MREITNFVCLMFARRGSSINMESITNFVCLLFARIGASITMERDNEFCLFAVCQNRCFTNYEEK